MLRGRRKTTDFTDEHGFGEECRVQKAQRRRGRLTTKSTKGSKGERGIRAGARALGIKNYELGMGERWN